MVDLVHLLARLHNSDGSIAVPGLMDTVRPVTAAERATYEPIDFSPEEFRAEIGAPALRHGDKEGVLMARWRYPSLSIHGVEGAWAGAGAKTVLPRQVRRRCGCACLHLHPPSLSHPRHGHTVRR